MTKKESTAILNGLRKLFYEYEKDIPRLEKEMKKKIREARETGDIYTIGLANCFLAMAMYQNGERDSILSYAVKAAALLKESDDDRIAIFGYNTLGIAYIAQENYQFALEAYTKGYNLAKKNRGFYYERMFTQSNIADCYSQLGDYKTAIKVFNRCLKFYDTHNPQKYYDITVLKMNLAYCHERMENYDRAEEILQSVGKIINKVDSLLWIVLYHVMHAFVLYKKGEKKRGDVFIDRVLSFEKIDNCEYVVYEMFEKTAHELVKIKDYERAKRIGNLLSCFSDKYDHTLNKLIAARTWSDYYNSKGESNKALEYSILLNSLYEKRSVEIRQMQYNSIKKVQEAEKEIRILTEKVRENEEAALRDPLTKLLNRAALIKVSSEFIKKALKNNEKIGALFFDVDYFKQCNDTYGHSRGDEILKTIADACIKEVTPNVRFARYGGDEFFGIMYGSDDRKLRETAQNICRAVRKANIPNIENPNGQIVTISMGIVNVEVSSKNNTIIDIANCADKALYYSKENGRNRIYQFDYDHFDEKGERSPYIPVEF